MDRRQALQVVAGASAIGITQTLSGPITQAVAQTMPPPAFSLPSLGYAYDALEPHIDAETMRIHYEAHHAGYVRNLNKTAEVHPDLAAMPMAKILRAIDKLPADIQSDVRNNMGGHWNHTFFWSLIAPGGPREPQGKLKQAIAETFGSLGGLQSALDKTAVAQFGSGWAWLAVAPRGQLTVVSTSNQDTPHMLAGVRGAVLGVDLWEHAYYLKHRGARAAYLSAWWNVVNWDRASEAFDQLLS